MVYTTYSVCKTKDFVLQNLLLNAGIRASDVGIYKFHLWLAKTGCILRCPGSGRPSTSA